MKNTLTIGGRQYEVSGPEESAFGTRYRLTGVRGASYFTMRMVSQPGVMFLVGRLGMVDPLGKVFLSDRAGALEIVR